MLLTTDQEKEQAIAELSKLPTEVVQADLDYFKASLAGMTLRGATEEATLQVRKQIEILSEVLNVDLGCE